MSPVRNPVVVGIDGSDQSLAAVTWAAREAQLRDRALLVVHAFVWPLLHVDLEPPVGGPVGSGLRNLANRYLTAAVERARATAPSVQVEEKLYTGNIVGSLLAAGQGAEMLAVGSRGLGGFTGLLVGSTGVTLAAHATCPVVVVRPASERPGPSAGRIVVGVDGSPLSNRAVEFAFDEAHRRGIGVTALHAWREPASLGPGDMRPLVYDIDLVNEEETRLLAEALAGWRHKYPDVDLRQEVRHANPARALVEESHGAELVVVGSRGRGGFRGLLLGSVSQALLHHAGCPVMVIPRSAS